ncbi:hypothetical protein L596_027435 [Steinernema carpocapsae]|uniref:Uncharacterized protein n=1 Tax=Steinernema carpocapsae TaxID=34508 RepID=A0A4U5M4A5_STECR|nr:hypothetical protein L596_027435 [Steinernema carpocapsae]
MRALSAFIFAALTVSFYFLLSTVVAKKKVFRYTEVQNSINGTFGVSFTVSASNDCSTEALKNNASAIKVIWGNGSIQCSLVTNIRSFLPLKVEETKSICYYIADLRESDTCSRNVETGTTQETLRVCVYNYSN